MFHAARIRLTAWYLLILMTISICFSVVIYRIVSIEVERFAHAQRIRIERNLHATRAIPPELTLDKIVDSPVVIDPDIAHDIKTRMQLMFLFINGGIFFVAGGLSYFLAGKTLEPISEMIDDQTRFVSDASHELRTPLTAMKSSLEVYSRDPKLTLAEARKVITDNIEEVNKLQSLSESLLELTHHDLLVEKKGFSPFSIQQVAEEVIKKMQPIAQKKQTTIKGTIDAISLLGNKEKIAQLIMIVLDNAIKYSYEKTEITVATKRSGKYFFLSVSDNGIGIKKEDIPHIFDRFYRADNARSKIGKGGYGLGLAIAKQIAATHGGTIEITSKERKGTTVAILLPVSFSSFSD